MAEVVDDELFARVAGKVEPRGQLVRVWELRGGVSAQVTGLEIALPDGASRKLVVRQHGAVDRQHNPQIAADEFRLLQGLHAAGLPVPEPYYLDQSGEIFPTPYVVVEYVEGGPEFAPANRGDMLDQLAAHLARIHQVDWAALALAFLPRLETRLAATLRARPAQLDESLNEGRIRDALETGWPVAQRNAPVLLHGDFWLGNILWQAGRVAAILDWEDSQIGDPAADLANSRLEILWAFGVEAMQRFTEQYQARSGIDCGALPYWDLWAALRPAGKLGTWGLDPGTERTMRERHHWFITQAFAQRSACMS